MSIATDADNLTNSQPGRVTRDTQGSSPNGSPEPHNQRATDSFHSWSTPAAIDPLLKIGLSRRVVWIVCGVLALAALVWFSSYLAAVRIYQVDECQNLYMAKILAAGQSHEFFTNASLFLLGPLSWITKAATRSEDALAWARLVFLGVFWLNLALLALIAGGRICSGRTLLALIAAATLAPVWDYGFEIRHDNLILTGVLLIWYLTRVKNKGTTSYFLAGAITVTMLFIAVKSVVYVIPLSLAVLAFPPPNAGRSRLRSWVAWLGGLLSATILVRLCYGNGGGWDRYLAVFHGVTRYSTGGGGGSAGFAPWSALGRLPAQTPLLLALTVGACLALAAELVRSGRRALCWDGNLPELLLLFGALGALFLNPSPYPYNLIHLVPYAFILVFRFTAGVWNYLWTPTLKPLVVGTLVFAHLVPFGVATRRHLDWPNWRQTGLMRLAESMTDPVKDPVYDGIGMVTTRPAIHYLWYLHGLIIQSFIDGSGPRVRDMLAARPAPVFIPNYRTDWLHAEDHEFIRQHYVSLADDLWVLGKVLDAGGGTFEITHPGRYRISTLEGSDLAGTYPEGLKGMMTPEVKGAFVGTLDGQPLTSHPVYLTPGIHRIETTAGCQPAVVWVGPHLERVHRVPPSDHRRLFYNWY